MTYTETTTHRIVIYGWKSQGKWLLGPFSREQSNG